MSRLYACKLQVYIPGSSTASASTLPWASRPFGVAPDMVVLESTDTIRVSDIGFVDLSEGIYPPLLDRAFDIDRAVSLAPGSDAVGASWGTMTFLNPGGTWDSVVASKTSDGRPVEVYTGAKIYETYRGIFKDPAFSSLNPVFLGLAKNWTLSENTVEIPLVDATYFLEKPIQSSFYLGTGGYEGPSNMAGTPKPKARGGTSTYPISNISPVLIDATNLVYQYNDAPGTVVALYEGGAVTYTSAGNVSDLYASPPSPGQFKTDNTRGLVRLGTKPIRPITADVTGQFPTSGVKTVAADIALELLREDCVINTSYIDTTSFSNLATTYPWVSGYYFSTEMDATMAVSLILRGIGAKLVSTRAGKLKAIALRPVTSTDTPVVGFSVDQIVRLTPTKLSAPLDPPADFWRIGWGKNHTVQNSDVSSATSDARKTFITNDWRISGFFSAAVNAAYRRPSRPPTVETALLNSANADSLAASVGALWSTRRRLYSMEVPVDLGLARDLGDIIRVSYPTDDLTSGRLGVIVGEQFRSTDETMTFQVLV